MLKKVRWNWITLIALIKSAPEVNGVYSGPRPILHPCFMETSPVVFELLYWQTDQTDTGKKKKKKKPLCSNW